MNNPQLLIDAIVQQTMVFIAQLATAGGLRAPLAGVANKVFNDLSDELSRQGVKKKVIADMFGMALRTYHRRSQELRVSATEGGTTLWEAVYTLIQERERVSAVDVLERFRHDDVEMVTGILSDLVSSGLVYRAGRGNLATYKIVEQEELNLSAESSLEAHNYLVWLAVYRDGPLTGAGVEAATRLSPKLCDAALSELVEQGRVRRTPRADHIEFESESFDVPLGSTQGWEAAVLDHFKAMISAIIRKLQAGPPAHGQVDVVGGSTWSLDVWPGHPLEQEARGTLTRLRQDIEGLRERIDHHNVQHPPPPEFERVIAYLGQYVQSELTPSTETR